MLVLGRFSGMLLWPAILAADTLYLKSGEKIEDVQITGQTQTHVEYREERSGPTRRVAKSSLSRLTYGPVDWEMKRIKLEKEKLRKEEQELLAMQARRDDPARILAAARESLAEIQERINEKRSGGNREAARQCNVAALEKQGRNLEEQKRKKSQELSLAIEQDEARIRQDISGIEQALQEIEQKKKAAAAACRGLDSVPLQLSAGESARLQNDLSALKSRLERAQQQLDQEREIGSNSSKIGRSSAALEVAEWQHRYRTLQERQRAALWRNLVLPGWGHRHLGARTRGWGWTAAAATSLAAFYTAEQELARRKAEYLDPLPLFFLQPIDNQDFFLGRYIYGQRAARLQQAHNQYQLAALVLGAVWIGSSFDLTLLPPASGTRTGWGQMSIAYKSRF
ncbi:MAG: hypothetical protein HS115_14335 [Spirochaetales bacterium]|nr:hypothetical protein [Spirochaetales bacterium]